MTRDPLPPRPRGGGRPPDDAGRGPVHGPDAGARADDAGDDRPPIGRSWGLLYAIVLANLAVLIVLFYILTETTS